MFSKIDVNGDTAAPLYSWLTGTADDDGNTDIQWNFTKFLIGRDGEVVARFGPQVTPEDIETAITDLL